MRKNHITAKDGFIHFYLSSPNFEIWGNYPIFPEQPLDEIEELQIQGMNAKQVARFVHLFNLLFCRG